MGLGLGLAYGVGIEKMRLSAPLVMLALGGLTLALCGMALLRVIDPLLRPPASGGGPAARSPARGGRLRELEREKQAVLKAIKEVELDYQMRKLAEADYREMTERYRARALRLLSDLDAGDDYRQLIERELKDRLAAIEAGIGAPVKEMSPGGCTTCGSRNDADAVFCKKCGTRIDR